MNCLLLTVLSFLSFALPSFQQDTQYALFFTPGATITYFQNTQLIPDTSPNPSPENVQAVWSGLEPNDGAEVFQTVVESASGGPDTWWIESQICCSPQILFGTRIELFPGDLLQSIFELRSDGSMIDSWSNTRGNNSSGDSAFSGSAVVDGPAGYWTQALFSVEIQLALADWDFGPVSWTDVVISAQTGDTSWCSPSGWTDGFDIYLTNPGSSSNGDTSTCTFEMIEFVKM